MKMNALLTFQMSENTNPTTQRNTPVNTEVTTPHLAQVGFSTSRATVSFTTVPIFVFHICYTFFWLTSTKWVDK